jgi:hypothetical protein
MNELQNYPRSGSVNTTPDFSRFSVGFELKTAHFFRFQPLFAQRKCSPGFA